MSHVFRRYLVLLLLLGGSWQVTAVAQTQHRGLPGVSTPGVSESQNGYEVSGTGLAVTGNSIVVDVGQGRTVNLLINSKTLCSVKGRATPECLFRGARVQVTGNLSQNAQLIHDASVTLVLGTAIRNAENSGSASERDPSWLQFTGTIMSVSPVVVQADRGTGLRIKSPVTGGHLAIGGMLFGVQPRGEDKAVVFVEFGRAVEFAGERPNVRSFVYRNGVANYVTITRAETIEAGSMDARFAKPMRRKVKAQ